MSFGVGLRVDGFEPELYLWRWVGCGALFASPEKHRGVVPQYYGEQYNPCGHRIDPVGFVEHLTEDTDVAGASIV